MSSRRFFSASDSALAIACEMPRRKQDDSSLGPRLTGARKAHGLTQAELAHAAGATQRSVFCYENDDGIPPASMVIELAKALKISSDELLLGILAAKARTRPRGFRFAQDCGRDFRWSPLCLRKTVIGLIDSLVSLSCQQKPRNSRLE